MYFIYSSENCPKCTTLKDKLKQKEIEYVEINVRETISAANYLRSKGYRGIPVLFQLVDGIMVDVTSDFS